MNYIDFREEFYSKSLRRLVIISSLMSKKKFANGVPKRVAIIADFLLCNPEALQNFLEAFGKPQQSLRINEILYHDNIANGAVDDMGDFGRTIAFLCELQLVKFDRVAGEIMLTSMWLPSEKTTPLMEEWKSNLSEIAPLLTSRSENVLYKKILGLN